MNNGVRRRLSRQSVAIALVAAALAFSGAGPLAAQDMPTLVRFDACCTITAIDAAAGVVRIRDEASVRMLRIRVADREVLKKLRIGHRVAVHFPTATARFPTLVTENDAHFRLIPEGVRNGDPVREPNLPRDCCTIVSVDRESQRFVVQDRTTGARCTYRLNEAEGRELRTLETRRSVDASLLANATLLAVEGVDSAESAGGCGPDAGGDDGVPRSGRR